MESSWTRPSKHSSLFYAVFTSMPFVISMFVSAQMSSGIFYVVLSFRHGGNITLFLSQYFIFFRKGLDLSFREYFLQVENAQE